VTLFEQAFKNVDDVLWKEAGCTTELDYTEQTSWLLFRSVPGRERADVAVLKGGSAIDRARGPERRTTPIPPRPGGVEMATMVSCESSTGVFSMVI
jgi:hypothetical protein